MDSQVRNVRKREIVAHSVFVYTFLGAVFGACCPLLAWVVDIANLGLPFTFDSIQFIHFKNPSHFIADLAPGIMALVFAKLGSSQRDLVRDRALLRSRVDERTHELQVSNEALNERTSDLENTSELYRLAAKRFEDLFEGLPVACFTVDRSGCVYEWNRKCAEVLGKSTLEAYLQPVDSVVELESGADRWREMFDQAFEGHEVNDREFVVLHEDGSRRFTLTSVIPITGPEDDVCGAVCASIDITERKSVEIDLALSEGRFRTAMNALFEGVMVVDSEGRIQTCNPCGAKLLQLEVSDIVGKSLYAHPWDVTDWDGNPVSVNEFPVIRSLRKGEVVKDAVLSVPLRSGDRRWLSLNSSPLTVADGGEIVAAVVSFSDITESIEADNRIRSQMQHIESMNRLLKDNQVQLQQANARLKALAKTDGLTGLMNHRAFQNRLAREVERCNAEGQKLSLLMIDVDDFKRYNDTFGHPAGDEVLSRVSRVLESCAGPTDCVARYGGEEFALVLLGADERRAGEVAERILEAMNEAKWPKANVTLSIGISTTSPRQVEGKALIEEADNALYAAKSKGKNCFVHSAGLNGIRVDRRRKAA